MREEEFVAHCCRQSAEFTQDDNRFTTHFRWEKNGFGINSPPMGVVDVLDEHRAALHRTYTYKDVPKNLIGVMINDQVWMVIDINEVDLLIQRIKNAVTGAKQRW